VKTQGSSSSPLYQTLLSYAVITFILSFSDATNTTIPT
jgi:hypothetical protein